MNSNETLDNTEISAGDLHSVQSLANTEPGLNPGGIRWLIHKHRDELIECGILFYMGRKPLIARTKILKKLNKGCQQ